MLRKAGVNGLAAGMASRPDHWATGGPPRYSCRTYLLSLGAGMTFGFGCAFLLLCGFSVENRSFWLVRRMPTSVPDRYSQYGHFEDDDGTGPENPLIGHGDMEEFHGNGEDMLASQLRRKVRVLCWVMTQPKNHAKKARHVKATWGQRCNTLLFMSSAPEPSLPTVVLPIKESRNTLWAKTKAAFLEVYKNHLNSSDWFLKADDDTYVVLENLRYLLKDKSPSDPVYYGRRFKPYVEQGYMSGGAGYVLSREAVRRLVEDGLSNPKKCRSDGGGSEDVEIGKCLEKVGVKAGDSRDLQGRGRFFPLAPEFHLVSGKSKDFWYWKYIYYPSKEGLECCSDTAISFHYISPGMMYVMEYLIYHLRPYGIDHMVHQHPGMFHDLRPAVNNPKPKEVTSERTDVSTRTIK